MTHNPYAPPQAPIADEPEPPRIRPRVVVVAVALLWSELALSTISWIFAWQHQTSGFFRIYFAVYSALWFGVSILVNTKVWQGRNWARIVGLVLTLYALTSLQGIQESLARELVTTLLGLAGLVMDIAALVLVFGPGREWFRRRS